MYHTADGQDTVVGEKFRILFESCLNIVKNITFEPTYKMKKKYFDTMSGNSLKKHVRKKSNY